VPAGPGYQTQLAVAGKGVDAGWITGPLASAWHTQHVRELPLPPDSARWWGTSRLVEFTAYIADVGMLYQLVTSVRRDTCTWCGLEVIGDQCLFCATRLGERSAPAKHAAAPAARGVEPPRRPQQLPSLGHPARSLHGRPRALPDAERARASALDPPTSDRSDRT